VNSTLTLTNGALDVSANNYGINVAGDWIDTGSGSFTERSGTVTFDGSSGTINSNEAFKNVTINSSGTTSLGASLTVNGTLTITAGTFSLAGYDLSAITLSNDATFRLQGNETVAITSPDTDSGNFEYVGRNSSETLTIQDIGSTDYFNLTINDANTNKATFVLGAALDVNGTLTLTSGTFDVSASNHGITVAGGWTDTGSGIFTERSGTVTFDGTGIINANEAFNNVTINAPSTTVTLGAVLDVNGTLILTSGTLDVSGSNYGITVAGGWTDTGTGAFNEQNGTVTFDGIGIINANEAFHNVTISASSATVTLGAILDVNGTLALTAGTLDVSASNYGITVAGGWTDTGGGMFNEQSGTVTFNGIGTINANEAFNNVTIDATSATVTLGAALDVDGMLTLTAGTLDVSGSNYSISVAGGWTDTGSGVFNERSGTVSFDGPGTLNADEAFKNVTINTSSTVTLGANASVDGTLTFTSGTITTGSNKVIINSSGSISQTSGHVIGNLQKYVPTGSPSLTYEIGNASNYTPASFSFTNVSSAGNLTGNTTSGDHSDISNSGIVMTKSVNRYWSFSNSGTSFSNYDLTLNFVAGDVDGGANTSSFVVAKKDGSTWSIPTVGSKTSTSTQATGMTSFSDFQIGELPLINFTSANQSGTENSVGTMTITAQLSVASSKDVTVPFTGSGTASNPSDYTITSSPITITTGNTTGTITITVNGDAIDEQDETVIVEMGIPTNATQGSTITHTATINDDDDPPSVSFTTASQTGAEDVGTMTVTAQLSAVTGKNVTVPFTVSGTATNPADYTITSSPVTISAGSNSANITITVVDDAPSEGLETVIVTMGTPTNATKGSTDVHTATIDDNSPTVTITSSAGSSGSYTNTSPIPFTATFSESVTGFLSSEITAGNGSVGNFSGSSTIYTFNVTPSGNGAVTVDIAANVAQDAASNGNEAATQFTITYDNVTPTVSSVSSTKDNGSYTESEVIPITVTFSEAVNVTGIPQLTLETGTSDAVLNYSSGSGGTTLTFNYTVASDHINNDLDYIDINSLALNSGTIKDAAENNATLTLPTPGQTNSLGTNKNLVIDAVVPTVSSLNPADNATGVASNADLTVNFSENLVKGTGNIVIYNSNDTAFETISVGSAKVSVSGSQVIIYPDGTFASSASYYVKIDATAFDDATGNSYTGISDNTTWNFTAADVTSPTVSNLSPTDDAINVGVTLLSG